MAPVNKPTHSGSLALQRLDRIRRTVRRRLLAYGLLAVAAGSILSFFVVVALDWLLWLPAALRIFVTLAFFAGFVAGAWYWIIAPIRMPLDLRQIAARLESHFGHLEDRLISMVDFLRKDDALSDPMVRQLIVNTSQRLGSIPLESALSIKPLVRAAGTFGVAVVALTAVLLVSPDWAMTGVIRYTDPFGPTEWPRRVRIESITHNLSVALGESAAVRMRLTRGFEPGIRGIVHVRESDGHQTTLVMHGDGASEFYATIDAITDDLEYWFEAGDDSTKHRPSIIQAVRRPVVIEAVAVIEPPPYAVDRPNRTEDLLFGSVQAPVGGEVTVVVRSSKPIPINRSSAAVGLQTKTNGVIPLVVDPDDAQSLSARWTVTTDVTFTILLTDDMGFENRGAVENRIEAVPDLPPSITIVQPAALTETTPSGLLNMVVRVRDDFGIQDLWVDAERVSTQQRATISLLPHIERINTGGDAEVVATHSWRLDKAFQGPLLPGDDLLCRVVAEDNYVGDGAETHRVTSSPFRVHIISDVEFEMRIRDEVAALEASLRVAELEQTELLEATATAAAAAADDTAAHSEMIKANVVHGIAGRQSRVTRRVRDMADRLTELSRRISAATGVDSETSADVGAMASALDKAAESNLGAASDRLRDAAEMVEPSERQAKLHAAASAQRDGLAQLRAVLDTLGDWGNFRTLTTKTQDLLDRQRTLTAQTAGLGQSLLGKRRDSLNADEEAALRRLRTRQSQLADESEQLLARLGKISTEASVEESVAAASEAALRAGRAGDIIRHAREASQAVSENRTAAAAMEQRKAEAGLSKVLEALQERDRRELERLQKRLVEVAQTLRQLIEDQTSIRAATVESRLMEFDPETLARVTDEQRQLAVNTEFVADDLARTEEIVDVGRLVRQSSERMMHAVTQLNGVDLPDAESSQNTAIALLGDALALALELEQQAGDDLLARTLADIRDDLGLIVEAQSSLNEGFAELAGKVGDKGRVTRTEARQASKLARRQTQTHRQLEAILPDVEEALVYRWALRRVGKWMIQSVERLETRAIDASLMRSGQRIVRELNKLIDAIDQTQKMPVSDEFAEGGGGGGASGGASTKPIPTITELLVLKSLQGDINDRTSSLAEDFDATIATEEELRALTGIAEDQAEVRELTKQVTKRARTP